MLIFQLRQFISYIFEQDVMTTKILLELQADWSETA